MSRATPDDQLKFLLSCVRHSNNGKIDFVEVAKECGVVSKGAAAKRYERLLKANGIHPNGGVTEKPPMAIPGPKQRTKAEIAKAAAAKRRKIEGDNFNFNLKDDEDEDDFKSSFKLELFEGPAVKSEYGSAVPSFALSHMDRPRHPPPPYFNTSLPRMLTPSPFAPPSHGFPQHHQSSPSSHFVSSASLPGQPSQLSNADASPTEPSNVILEPRSEHTVTEEQIDSMYEEFCVQDMFKQPNFGLSTTPPALETPSLESQVQKQPAEASSEAFCQPSQAPPQSQPSPVPHTVAASNRWQASGNGNGIDNCIVILD